MKSMVKVLFLAALLGGLVIAASDTRLRAASREATGSFAVTAEVSAASPQPGDREPFSYSVVYDEKTARWWFWGLGEPKKKVDVFFIDNTGARVPRTRVLSGVSGNREPGRWNAGTPATGFTWEEINNANAPPFNATHWRIQQGSVFYDVPLP